MKSWWTKPFRPAPEITSKIEGLYRHASTHPAGVVIGDRPLDEILPLYRDPRSDMPVTQFDYEDAEKAGLVKFDFLGLKTLTVISKAQELLHLPEYIVHDRPTGTGAHLGGNSQQVFTWEQTYDANGNPVGDMRVLSPDEASTLPAH